MRLLILLLLTGCASQDLTVCEANASANHLMRLKTECIAEGYTVDNCPFVDRIDGQLDEEWGRCQR